MIDNNIKQKLRNAFPGSIINAADEFVASRLNNDYFRLEDCNSLEDVQCKVLEWFSRSAHKGIPFQDERDNLFFQEKLLNSINRFLGTTFSKKDITKIYDILGNACKHNLTVQFVRHGFDMDYLIAAKKKYPELLDPIQDPTPDPDDLVNQNKEERKNTSDSIGNKSMRDQLRYLVRNAGYTKDVCNSDGKPVSSFTCYCVDEDCVDMFVDFLIRNGVCLSGSDQKSGYVIRFDNGSYWCGMNQITWDLREAQIYKTEKNARSSAEYAINKRDGLRKRALINGFDILRVSIKIEDQIATVVVPDKRSAESQSYNQDEI